MAENTVARPISAASWALQLERLASRADALLQLLASDRIPAELPAAVHEADE